VLSGDEVSALLHAIATGYPDRAKNVIVSCEQLDDVERERLYRAVDGDGPPAERVRLIGDVLREFGTDRSLANECYRLAFYLGDDPVGLANNPLFAYFIGHRSGRTLDKWVHYFPIYDHHLSRFRNQAPSVLEIGVFEGGSLSMWDRYFGSSSKLVGLDIDPAAAGKVDPRMTVVIGDQSDPAVLESVVQRYGPFDVIIDDGGHTMEQQISSIEALFPTLSDGGVYIVEDCHTSYWEEFEGGLGRKGTFIEWVKDRVDDLHAYHRNEPVHPTWTEHVNAIHLYDSVVVFDKHRRFVPFSERAGASEFVYYPRGTSALVGEMLATRDAALAQRDAATAELEEVRRTIGEELRLVRGELAALKPLQDELGRVDSELSVTINDLLEAWDQAQKMRQTLSWRITAPLRMLRRRSRRG
jgi:hypothetical protein